MIDIIQGLAQQVDYQIARKYWNKVKERLKKEGSQPVTNCHQLKMIAEKEGEQFAILTNIIHQEWADVSVKEHKDLKGLQRQNLRDHMSEAELIFTALAELSTRQIAETVNATGMPENKASAKMGGGIAKKARLDLEDKTGKKVVTKENYLLARKTSEKIESE